MQGSQHFAEYFQDKPNDRVENKGPTHLCRSRLSSIAIGKVSMKLDKIVDVAGQSTAL